MNKFHHLKYVMRGGYIALLFLCVLGYFLFNSHKAAIVSAESVSYPNLKVAFVGDDGIGQNNTDVLNLIKSEGSAFAVDGGDLDYTNNPTNWDTHVTNILGSSYPYFVAEGNHDAAQWSGYSQKLSARYNRVSGESCTGPNGQMQACTYKGVLMLLLAPDISGAPSKTDQINFIKQQLAGSNAKWKICVWHLNMGFGDWLLPGGDIYEACREGGAIISNAHFHYYMRTKTLTNVSSRTVDPTCNLPTLVCVALGKTFVFVSGLGGKSLDDPDDKCPDSGCKGEWAKIYTASKGATYGALFIIFNYNGDANKAHGYFKNTSGQVVDSFDISLQDTPTENKDITSGKTYRLVNKCSAKVLAIPAVSQDATTGAIQWPWTAGLEQQWKITYLGNGYYSLAAKHSGQMLDVSGWSTADGARATQYPSTGGANQQWGIIGVGNGYYKLLAHHSGKALDLNGQSQADGAWVDQWTDNGTCAQQWQIEDVAAAPPVENKAIVSGTTYRLMNACSNKSLAIRGASQVSATDAIQWHWTGGSEQQWKISYLGSGYYSLMAQHSGMLLNVDQASWDDGMRIIQWPDATPANNEQWSILSVGGGYYQLFVRHSRKALDVSGQSVDDGAKIQQWTPNDSCAQQWKIETFTPVPTVTSPTTAQPAATVAPTEVPAPGTTIVKLSLALHGIGNGGDNLNPNAQGNISPLHPEQTVSLQIYDSQNNLVLSQDGSVIYNNNSGKFEGNIDLGTGISTGQYTVKAKVGKYLRTLIPGIQTITSGQTNTLPSTSLMSGDINDDNSISILDYNILMGCYSDLLPPVACASDDAVAADLTDDGHVNQFDYNFFLRELSARSGN